jgi:hypothetical protein
LQAKISNDPKYKNIPLTVSFDVSAVNPNIALFEQIVIYYAIPIIALIGTVLIVLKILRRRKYKS